MAGYMGPQVLTRSDERRRVAGCVDIRNSTGLTRPDYFDWPAHARQQMSRRDPEAIVFMVGGNDGQHMRAGGRLLTAGSADWKAEYQRRATVMMRIYSGNGRRRVYWVGMPIARSGPLTGIYRVLNSAAREAAKQTTGVVYLDTWTMFTTKAGRYSDSLPDETGRVMRMRGTDGIHLNRAGSALLGRRVIDLLNADWHVTR